MDVLVLGCSSVFKRRVLPALNLCGLVDRIHVASKTQSSSEIESYHSFKVCGWYYDYAEALHSVSGNGQTLVYVTLPNDLHYEWAMKSLIAGHHVIVEKPAALSLPTAEALVDYATANDLCLAEAVVWSLHPQIEAAKKVFQEKKIMPRTIQASFTVPSFDSRNFRSQVSRGGGAFNDMAAYAVSVGRIFFGDTVESFKSQLSRTDPVTGLDESFKLDVTYPGGRRVESVFGFGFEYSNFITIEAIGTSVELTRVFSPPAATLLPVSVISGSSRSAFDASGDAYLIFFTEVMTSIFNNAYTHWAHLLLQDHVTVDRLRVDLFQEKEM